jgi:hypothetical protein
MNNIKVYDPCSSRVGNAQQSLRQISFRTYEGIGTLGKSVIAVIYSIGRLCRASKLKIALLAVSTFSLFITSCNFPAEYASISNPTAPQVVEATEAITLTPTPKHTPTPEPTPTPTEIPAPEIPQELIDSSWGFIDENSLQKDGDDWVLASKREGWADWILLRWDPQSGEWIDERPDFWECGRWPMLKDSLPTYVMRKEWELAIEPGRGRAVARGCLVEINSYPDPFYPGETMRGKMLFYDNNKKAHIYDFMTGGLLREEVKVASAICQDTKGVCWVVYFEEALVLFQDYLEKGKTGTRQIDFNFYTRGDKKLMGIYDVPLFHAVNKHSEHYQQLYQAILTGDNFPEPPEGFFIYALQFNITPQKLTDN